MKAILQNKEREYPYTDEQIIGGIRTGGSFQHLVIRSFFTEAKAYSLLYWQPKYPGIEEEAWEVIIANANLKLITRIKKGWTLQKEVKLTTYYTSVVGYAALDYLNSQNKSSRLEWKEIDVPVYEGVEKSLEDNDRSKRIRKALENIIGNSDQLKVVLLYADGYAYGDIVKKTHYQSEGACRNAFLMAKKKITEYLLQHPNHATRLRNLLAGNE